MGTAIAAPPRVTPLEKVVALEGFNLFDVLDQDAQTETKSTPKTHRASALLGCPRKDWFMYKGVPPSNPNTLSDRFKMNMGTAIGNFKSRWTNAALQRAYERRHGLSAGAPPPQTLLELCDKHCPRVATDILAASLLEKRPYSIDENVRTWVITEVPAQEDIGLEMPLSFRIDEIIMVEAPRRDGLFIPMGIEDKSSSAFSTNRITENRTTHLGYQLQLFVYMQHYSEIPWEMHYLDREWGYPYRFGMQLEAERGAVLQPGGLGRAGTALREALGMDPMEWIRTRRGWLEEALKGDTPPGELVVDRINAPRDELKAFLFAHLELPEFPGRIPEEDRYQLIVTLDGKTVSKKQADKVEYRSSTCGTFCNWRDHCMAGAKIAIAPQPTPDWVNWGRAA